MAVDPYRLILVAQARLDRHPPPYSSPGYERHTGKSTPKSGDLRGLLARSYAWRSSLKPSTREMVTSPSPTRSPVVQDPICIRAHTPVSHRPDLGRPHGGRPSSPALLVWPTDPDRSAGGGRTPDQPFAIPEAALRKLSAVVGDTAGDRVEPIFELVEPPPAVLTSPLLAAAVRVDRCAEPPVRCDSTIAPPT
jgi:hypothetical protein